MEGNLREIFGDPCVYLGAADNVFRLKPTVYYYGYEGSVTFPPCSDIISWRFLDLPMQISHDQYLMLQRIQLEQRDEYCKRNYISPNSAGYQPLQEN